MQNNKQLTKIAISVLVILFFLGVSGCSVLSYFKKKDIKGAEQYKSSMETNFNQAKATAEKFDELKKALNKKYYSQAEFTEPQGIAAQITVLSGEIPTAITKVSAAKDNASRFEATSTGKKYSSYIQTKIKSIDNVNKALEEDKKALEILAPKMSVFQSLFTYVAGLKKTQSINVTDLKIGGSRIQQIKENQGYYTMIVNMIAMQKAQAAQAAKDAATQQTATGSATTTTTDTTTTTSAQTSTDSTSSSGTSSGNEVPEWTIKILKNKHISMYFIKLLDKEENSIDSLYTDIYQANMKVKFPSTSSMARKIKYLRNDLSDMREIAQELQNNFNEQSDKNDELADLKNRKKSLDAAKTNYQSALSNLSSSNEHQANGYKRTLDSINKDISRTNKEITNVENKLSDLTTAANGRLTDDFDNGWWKYGGSLLNLIQANDSVSKNLMKDIKGWEKKEIGPFIKNHNYYLKLADYQAIRSELLFEETNKRVALLKK